MAYRLVHQHRSATERIALAEHVDLTALKQFGYDSARALGDEHALWSPSLQPGVLYELHCRSGHALLIEKPLAH
ncbi:hypothetical protein [Nitrogeniibacter aestuarii]|uniref:hypothetical protein n=1 Tax=Nitrogeniibacter aestuarii TaxID=2815343 RepID=UPI001D12EE1A|nr:hypothetical protein [Nitrogeniibacter aestuarii]